MKNVGLIAGGILGGSGVALGAFGAHGLESRLSPEMLATFEIGVRYQMYHALAALTVGAILTKTAISPWLGRAVWAWVFGVLVFSGSLYLYALTGVRWLGAITPIGGVAFLVGWAFVIVAGLSSTRDPDGE